MAVVREIRDDFPMQFFYDLSMVVVSFGRLERLILLSMKTLLITLGVSKDYGEGPLEAVRHENLDRKCGELCRLFFRAYGEGDAAWVFGIRLEQTKALGRRRNRYLHGAWTTDGSKFLLSHSRRNKSTNTLEDFTWEVTHKELADFINEVVGEFNWLYRYRETWPSSTR